MPKRRRPWGYARRNVKRRLIFRASRAARRRRRRVSRRRYPRRNRLSLRRRFTTAYPKVAYRRHKYNSEYTLSATTAVNGHFTTLNNLFDPNLTGGGHQPYNRDTMASLYKFHEVLYATIRTIVIPSVSNTVTMYAGQAVHNYSDAMPATTDHDAYKEHPRCNWKVINATKLAGGVNPDFHHITPRQYKFFKKCRPKRWLKDPENNEVAVSSEVPDSDKVVHNMWIASIDASTNVVCTVIQNVTFYVKWSRPVISAASS